jgi:hypothetical protein
MAVHDSCNSTGPSLCPSIVQGCMEEYNAWLGAANS